MKIRKSFQTVLRGVIFFSVPLISILTSCSEDENTDNTSLAEKPLITITNPDTSYLGCSASQTILIDLIAESNASSGQALNNFLITKKFGNEQPITFLDSTIIAGDSFALNSFKIVTNSQIGSEVWTFRITDASGQFGEAMLTFQIYPSPTVTLKTGIQPNSGLHYISQDTSLTVGTKVALGVISTTQSLENLKRLTVIGTYENVNSRTLIDTLVNSNSINYDITFFTYPNPGMEDFEISVWDYNGAKSIISFSITTQTSVPNLTIYSDVILGAQSSTTGGFFSSTNGNIYTLEEANANSEKIDFLYFFSDTFHATIAAPDDADAASIYTGANGLETWTTLNSTKFKVTTLSSSEFNGIQNVSQLIAIANLPTPPNISKITDLATGKVLAFRTADELFGLIRIDAINGANSNGTIELTVKVQN